MLNNKAMELLIRTAIGAIGIDANSFLANIQQFQGWVQNAIQHHDKRLVALENEVKSNGEKLDRIIEILSSDIGDVTPEHYPLAIVEQAARERIDSNSAVEQTGAN